MDVGFIGLGGTGKAMAANLVKAAHQVRVWNRSRPPVDALVETGGLAAATPADAFRGNAVITMLANDVATREIVGYGRTGRACDGADGARQHGHDLRRARQRAGGAASRARRAVRLRVRHAGGPRTSMPSAQ